MRLRHGWSPINIDKFYDTLLRLPGVPEVILPDFPRAGITMEIGRSREARRSILLLAVIYIFERSCFRSVHRGFHGPVSSPPPSHPPPIATSRWFIEVNDADPIVESVFDHRGSPRPIVYRGNTWRRDVSILQIARSS